MNKVLCTFGFGEASKWLELTGPLMIKYAMLHGYSFYMPSESDIHPLWKDQAHSWKKVDVLSSDFIEQYDQILWLDADVVIKDLSKDIMDDIPEGKHGNVVHETSIHGLVPNCGVWAFNNVYGLTRLPSWPWHRKKWPESELAEHMWEQGDYCKMLGGNDALPMEFPNGFPSWFHTLPYEWNVIQHDKRGIPSNLRFFHATIDGRGTPQQRLDLIKKWVDK